MRSAIERAEREASETDAELALLTERLADPSVYTDAALARDLIDRYNAARDRSESLAAEWTRLGEELSVAERETEAATPGARR